MKYIREVRVFISSPGDLEQERELVTEICNQITQDLGQIKGFRVDPIRWETHANSSRSERSQLAITEQVGEFDIYLGLMGVYFGSSTGAYSSGTEEEFEAAMQSNDETGTPLIQFYFSSAKVNLDDVDLSQFDRVKEFRRKIGERGVFYRRFDDLTQLQLLVRSGLQKAIFEVLEKPQTSEKVSLADSKENFSDLKPYSQLKNLEKLLLVDPEASSNFLLRDATTLLKSFTGRLKEVGSRTREFSNAFSAVTRELEKTQNNSQRSPKRAMRAIERAFGKFDDFIYWLAHDLPIMDSEFMQSMSDVQRAALLIKSEIPEGGGNLSILMDSVELAKNEIISLLTACERSIVEVQNLYDSGFSGLNAKVYVAVVTDFVDFLRRAVASMDEARQAVIGS